MPKSARVWIESRKTRYENRRGVRMLPPEALQQRYREALDLLIRRLGRDAIGDYLEFGVYTGTSLACMHRASIAAGLPAMRLFGFDSFSGLPDEAETDDEGVWRPRQYCSDYAFTRECLRREAVDLHRVFLTPGWYSDTLTPGLLRHHCIAKAGVIMVDCDLYSSARTALAFCAPLIRDQAVLFLDDWFAFQLNDKGLGERRAFDEMMGAHPFRAEDFPAYSEYSKAFIITRTGPPPETT